ncbi:hypothetical protein MMC29_006156 [Sticta canariensis]|nr:hypothetical protein [Sticta canariensis]
MELSSNLWLGTIAWISRDETRVVSQNEEEPVAQNKMAQISSYNKEAQVVEAGYISLGFPPGLRDPSSSTKTMVASLNTSSGTVAQDLADNSNPNQNFLIDRLTDNIDCYSDIERLRDLSANVIRNYYIDPSQNHS